MTEEEKKRLFLAVGFIVVSWGILESNCSLITNALYLNENLSKLLPGKPKRMPKFLDRQFAFQRQCLFVKDGPLTSCKQPLVELITRTEKHKDIREMLAHSALLEQSSSGTIYRFNNLDAKEIDHLATEWELDLSTFARYRENLGELVNEWSLMARKAIPLVEAF